MTRRLLPLLLAGTLALPAGAVITRLYPLADLIADAEVIVLAKVGKNDGKTVELVREAALKGKPPEKGTLLLTGGDDKTQVPTIRQRLKPGAQAVVFARGRYVLGYTTGGWFRADSRSGKPLQFVHLEPYLRRTYRGEVAALAQVVRDVLAGKRKAPAPDPNAKPG